MNDFKLTIPEEEIRKVLEEFKCKSKSLNPWDSDGKGQYFFKTTDVIRELYGNFYKSTRKRLNNKSLFNPQMGSYLKSLTYDKELGLICLGTSPTKDDAGKTTNTLRWNFNQ
ncbi:MAG: hypothetical protein E6931_11660 [Clostridium botulinum]|nr:hypothetical protein [Clostridium botulinum]